MRSFFQIISILFLFFLPVQIFGQEVRARVAGLENNEEYMQMLRQEKSLQSRADSTLTVINRTRQLLVSDPEGRQKYGEDILRLENEIFDVRNNIGVLTSRTSSIEQDFILKNMDKIQQSSGNTSSGVDTLQVRNLIYNRYFAENLPQADYNSLLRVQKMEPVPLEILKRFATIYVTADTLATAYLQAPDKETAAEIYPRYLTARAYIDRVADSVASVWGEIFETKVYNYNYLLDKINKVDQLNRLEAQFRTGSQQIASMRDKVISEAIYGYPIRKKLVLSYEEALADILGYKAAGDSIRTAIRNLEGVSYDFPSIDVEERYFIDYGAIEFSSPPKYNTRNPIPLHEVYPKGTVYRVHVGTFSRAQPVSVFRGVSPLWYEELPDGRYRYFVGGYMDEKSGEEAVETLKKRGFRKPELVVWRDGVYENITETAEAIKDGSVLFQIEISGTGRDMGDELKTLLRVEAEEKDLSRVSAPEGRYIYTVGMFHNREEADKLVETLNALPDVEAKVLLIEN